MARTGVKLARAQRKFNLELSSVRRVAVALEQLVPLIASMAKAQNERKRDDGDDDSDDFRDLESVREEGSEEVDVLGGGVQDLEMSGTGTN